MDLMLDKIVDLIRTNITWVKDLGTLLFSIVGSIIAVLTYRRAKETILQPIRSEVIKKQSEILTQLLEDVSRDLEGKIGYVELVHVNTCMILKEYGFVFNNDKEITTKISELITGWMPCGENKQLLDVEVISMLKDKGKDELGDNRSNHSKILFEKAKEGIIVVEKIYFTKEYLDFSKAFCKYIDTPFLPFSIQQILKKINNDIVANFQIHLKETLEIFMKEFCKIYFSGGQPQHSSIGVYNEFNHIRIHHQLDLDILKNKIREYLHIDDKW